MKKCSIVLTAIIFLTCSAAAQSTAVRKYKHGEKIVTTYDQTKNRTMVVLNSNVKMGGAVLEEYAAINLLCGFTYEGKKPNGNVKAVQFVLEILRTKERDNKSNIPDLLAEIDGTELNLGTPKLIKSTNEEVKEQIVRVNFLTEQIGLFITKEAFQRITSATKVKFKSGDVRFTLSEKHLEALRDLESRMN